MTKLECAAIEHANQWLVYQRSPEARRDAELDRLRRAKADKAAGHSPMCGLLKCHPSCKKAGG